MKYDEKDRQNRRNEYIRIRDKIKERLNQYKIKNGCDIGESIPDQFFPYKCYICGKNLIPMGVEIDIEKNIACFGESGTLWDVCYTCSGKLGLISKSELNPLKDGDIIGCQYVDGELTYLYYKEGDSDE